MLAKLKEIDFYRRIPKDLTETSLHGSVLSICAAIFMLVLFVAELWAFLSTTTITSVIVDPNTETQLRINFNITLMDMPCEFATIDVVDVLGTRYENVSKNVNKWKIDENGLRRSYQGRNVEQRDLDHDVGHDLDQLLENGVHAVPLDTDGFDHWLKQHQYTMVNFYAPWCVWCQRLEPVWEAFAEKVESEQLPVSVTKVDCVANSNLCSATHKIQAFPTVRLFKDGVAFPPDYRDDRTVDAFINYIKNRVMVDEHIAKLPPPDQKRHQEMLIQNADEHPGCLLSGFLLVNRVPGNFHIEARSKHHNLNPALANLSHIVNELSFGPPLTKAMSRRLELLPKAYFDPTTVEPVNGYSYKNTALHQAYHHYIKVVSTHIEAGPRYSGKDSILVYQMVHSAQIMQYVEGEVPEARFSYDLSPMSVSLSKKGRQWYEFITSICALIGGTFTVVGLLSGFLSIVFKSKKM